MKLRTGLQTLIGLSVLGVALAILLIFTCPFAGQIAFSTLVHQVPMEHGAGAGGPLKHPAREPQRHPGASVEAEGAEKAGHHEDAKGHPETVREGHETAAGHHEDKKGLSVHLMVVPNVLAYPVTETKVFGINVSPLGIIVLLFVIALCCLILRQRPVSLFGYVVTPKAMGVTVALVTVWNLVFAAFLLGVEVFQLREL